jgi:GT2 family glycosyltransferase
MSEAGEPARISLCIVSWNVRDDLTACLESVGAAARGCQAETIVVDNASSDGTVERLRECFPQLRLIVNADNRGFAAATNQAMAAARGDDLLLLNPDTVLPAGGLAELVACADAHPQAGIVAPRLANPDGSLQYSCRRFPSRSAALFRHTVLGRLFPNNRWSAEYTMAGWAHDALREVDWVSGACMLVRRALYARIGPLDEGFFWGSEDVDYCYRMHQAGYKVLYTPTPVIVHAIGASASQVPVRMIVHFHRGMHRLYRKHLSRNALDLALATVGIALRALLIILSRWLGLERPRR